MADVGGGDDSPQLDLDAIEARKPPYGYYKSHVLLGLAERDALVALVRRLQQENKELTAALNGSPTADDEVSALGAALAAQAAENVALRGRVEELTALIERMLKIHGDDYDALVAADYETADGLHELAEEAWCRDARALLAKVDPA